MGHLNAWDKADILYPQCNDNRYKLTSLAQLHGVEFLDAEEQTEY